MALKENKKRLLFLVLLAIIVLPIYFVGVLGYGLTFGYFVYEQFTGESKDYRFDCRYLENSSESVKQNYDEGSWPVQNVSDFPQTEQRLVRSAIENTTEFPRMDPDERAIKLNGSYFSDFINKHNNNQFFINRNHTTFYCIYYQILDE